MNVGLKIFSRTEPKILLEDKLLPVSNMASSRSEENVNLNYLFPTPNGVTLLDCPAILLGHICFVLIGRCCCHYLFGIIWQMLLPLLFLWLVLNHLFYLWANVIAIHCM